MRDVIILALLFASFAIVFGLMTEVFTATLPSTYNIESGE